VSWRAEIGSDLGTLRVDGGGPQAGTSGVKLSGWWGTPDSKWQMTERKAGDGAFDVPNPSVLYAARTVELQMWAVGDRSEQVAQMRDLLALAHRQVRLRVVDGPSDTYVTGLATVTDEAGPLTGSHQGVTLTLTCPDPRRLSTSEHLAYLYPPSSTSMGGLSFGAASAGLVYALDFGEAAAELRNFGTIANEGAARAYPVITVSGAFSGVRLDFTGDAGTRTVQYDGYVGGVPLVLDCRERRATIGGLDVSQRLSARGFPEIEPGSSVAASLQSAGSGWVEISSRDTYI
jgi:hypothetical protein